MFLSLLAGFGHSRMLGLGFPTMKKESYQGSGGPASLGSCQAEMARLSGRVRVRVRVKVRLG